MREILFRGKQITDRMWVTGGIEIREDKTYIIRKAKYRPDTRDFDVSEHHANDPHCTSFCIEVDPKTIGQYTGFKDKNGKMIFEGDIVSTRRNGIRTEKLKGYYGVDSDGYPQKVPGYEGETEYHYDCQIEYCALVEFSPRFGFYLRGTTMFVDAICNEVIGNVHDNPELLEEKQA
jgi:uncharacterized phage protein (TIGR01671 family)